MSAAGDDLASLQVTGLDGQPVRVGSLWRDRPLVLVFVRHFG